MELIQFLSIFVLPFVIVAYGCLIVWRYKFYLSDPLEMAQQKFFYFNFGEKINLWFPQDAFLQNILVVPLLLTIPLACLLYWISGSELREEFGLGLAFISAFIIVTIVLSIKYGYKFYKNRLALSKSLEKEYKKKEYSLKSEISKLEGELIKNSENMKSNYNIQLKKELSKLRESIVRSWSEKYELLEERISNEKRTKESLKKKVDVIAKQKSLQFENYNRKVEKLTRELNERNNDYRKEQVQKFNEEYEQAVRRNKESIIQELVSGNIEDAASHDSFFELARKEKSIAKREKLVEREEYKGGLEKIKIEAEQMLFQAKQERFGSEQLFFQFKTILLDLEKRILGFESNIKDQFRDNSIMFNNLNNSIGLITQEGDYKIKLLKSEVDRQVTILKGEIDNEISNTRNLIKDINYQISGEVLRMDKNIIKVVGELERYSTEIEKMQNAIDRVLIKADQRGWNAEKILKEAELINEKMDNKIGNTSNQLILAAEKISLMNEKLGLKDKELANNVIDATLRLDKISSDQYYALKDMAYDRMDVDFFGRAKINEIQNIQRQMERIMENMTSTEARIKFYLNEADYSAAKELKTEYYGHQRKLRGLQRRMARNNYLVDFVENDSYNGNDDYMSW